MRISDWSSDVCSSDLAGLGSAVAAVYLQRRFVGDHHVRDRLQLHPKWLEQLLQTGRSEDCSAIIPRHYGSTSAHTPEYSLEPYHTRRAELPQRPAGSAGQVQ